MQVSPIDTNVLVCGFNSHMARISVPNSHIKPFNITYTNDILINNVNDLTPFKEIKGVLLEFPIKIYGMDMKLTAKKVKRSKVSNEEFIIPKEYIQINKKTMIEIIELLKQ